jgi:hypothetical protein
MPNCWNTTFPVLSKIDGCQIDLANSWRCSKWVWFEEPPHTTWVGASWVHPMNFGGINPFLMHILIISLWGMRWWWINHSITQTKQKSKEWHDNGSTHSSNQTHPKIINCKVESSYHIKTKGTVLQKKYNYSEHSYNLPVFKARLRWFVFLW